MKVIIVKDYKKLGREGKVIEVKDGYARNYLIPRGLALLATDENFRKLEELKKLRVKLAEKEKVKYLEEKDKIEKLSLTVPVEAKENEELYGTVGAVKILSILENEGITLNKDQLALEEPIKKLGVYNLKINLHPEVQAVLRLWVVRQ
ncbi:MAG: 50S ribosomal protein L9 [Candidatus Omnitrophica bacterium]|nr:50S ribosomal protein L9 [Candidatus Omnitrophota bacterium]